MNLLAAIETTYMILNKDGVCIYYGTYIECNKTKNSIMHRHQWCLSDWLKQGYKIRSIYNN